MAIIVQYRCKKKQKQQQQHFIEKIKIFKKNRSIELGYPFLTSTHNLCFESYYIYTLRIKALQCKYAVLRYLSYESSI